MKINVMSFNMHHGKGTDGKLDLHRISKIIEENEVDFVGLNEVDNHFSNRSGNIDQMKWLSEHLNMEQGFGASAVLRAKKNGMERKYGNGLLSRYPVEHINNSILQARSLGIEGRTLLESQVNVEDKLIKIYVTHLSLNPLFHMKQVELILELINNDPHPVILMGDMNMKRGSKAWKKLTHHLTDVCYEFVQRPCATFPSFRPTKQLDYIFISSNILVDNVEVLTQHSKASDHLPMKATLNLNQEVH